MRKMIQTNIFVTVNRQNFTPSAEESRAISSSHNDDQISKPCKATSAESDAIAWYDICEKIPKKFKKLP